MTAVNILCLPDSVHLFTDTKAGIGGITAGSLVKCLPIPHLNAAVATRGEAGVLQLVHRIACQYASYDDLRQGMCTVLLECRRMMSNGDRRALLSEWDAFFIGYGKSGPDAFGIFSHDRHGYPAFKVFEIPFAFVTPTIPHDLSDMFDGPDPLTKIGSVMALQRSTNAASVGSCSCARLASRARRAIPGSATSASRMMRAS